MTKSGGCRRKCLKALFGVSVRFECPLPVLKQSHDWFSTSQGWEFYPDSLLDSAVLRFPLTQQQSLHAGQLFIPEMEVKSGLPGVDKTRRSVD